MNILIEEDKLNHNLKLKGEKHTYPKFEYFIEKEKLNILFSLAVY